MSSVGGGLTSCLGSLLTASLPLLTPLGLLFLDGSRFLPDIYGPSCPLGSVMSSVSICRRDERMGRWPEFPHWPVMLQGRVGSCRVLWTGALLSDQAQQGERASLEELYNLFYPL